MAFKNEDMPRFRREMKQELIDRRLSHGPSRTANNIKLERRISNFDGETCWLNSILQMILCAMDHNPYHHMFSTLGMELQRAQTQGLIDPRYMKLLLQSAEDARDGDSLNIMVGQQCARDALVILTQNREAWIDIYSLLYHTTRQTTTCLNCSAQSYCDNETLYTEHFCPEDNTNLKLFLERISNHSSSVEYFCNQCNIRGEASQKLQIKTEESSSFFAILLSRVEFNYTNQIHPCDDVRLIDCNGVPRDYTPLCVIEHRGGISDSADYTRHYLADVKNKMDGQWYHTSNATEPKKLSQSEVTKTGYIFLYMRKE